MKATDLMSGDLLLHKGYPIKVSEILIDGINPDWDGNENCGNEAIYKDLQPIPLTPEILERNWSKKTKYGCYIIGRTDEDFYFGCFRGAALQIGIDTGAYETPIFATIHYVHELQHVLKLCGIEKEIVL